MPSENASSEGAKGKVPSKSLHELYGALFSRLRLLSSPITPITNVGSRRNYGLAMG